jgi:hypothetical protein
MLAPDFALLLKHDCSEESCCLGAFIADHEALAVFTTALRI